MNHTATDHVWTQDLSMEAARKELAAQKGMEMKWKRNGGHGIMTTKLRSGRVLRANEGLLSPSMKDETLHEGYDGYVLSLDDVPLTEEERKEIAEHMIERWRTWVNQ